MTIRVIQCKPESNEYRMNLKVQFAVVLLFSILIADFFQDNTLQAADKKFKERLAVLDLEAKHGVEKSLAEALSVIVRDKLHSFGDFEVLSRSDIQAVASREAMKQTLGCDNDGSQCLVDFGRAIGTRFMVAGDISKLGATYTLSLRMLDTKGQSAGVKNRVSESCKCDEDALIVTIQDVAARLVGKQTDAHREGEEKRKTDELEKLREEVLANELRKAEEQKQKLVPKIEKLKKEKDTAIATTPKVASDEKSAPGKTYTDPTTGMEFVLVSGGCYQMGDTLGDWEYDEKPVHEVCVDSFYLGKYEVTQGEYTRITGNNPSNFKKGDRYPVEQVNWNDTQSFIRSLNSKSGRNFRLPTEAEWEYAARSGGKKEKFAGGVDIDTVAWYISNSDGSTHLVGSKHPNGLGLYDMSGNVWEWCNDWHDSDYYGKSVLNNPEGPSSGSFRVARGGGWNGGLWRARATARDGGSPGDPSGYLGFRLALPVQRP